MKLNTIGRTLALLLYAVFALSLGSASARAEDNGARALAIAKSANLPTIYTANVVTRTGTPTLHLSQTQMMGRSGLYARDNITTASVCFANWYPSASVETANGAAATITASIEYPAGTFKQLLFSGSATGTAADGATLCSDYATVSVPKNALFWVREYFTSSAGIVYQTYYKSSYINGDAWAHASSGITDQTMGGTITSSGTGFWSPPLAVLARTRLPSPCFVGDSRVAGQGDTMNGLSGDVGSLARSIGPSLPYINMGMPGETLTIAINNYTRRAALANLACSHVIIEEGINDIHGSALSAGTVAAARTTMAGLFPGKVVGGTTLEPVTTSTDSWATATNQTNDGAKNTARTAFNDLERAGISGESFTYDIASTIEVDATNVLTQNGGLWIAPPLPGLAAATAATGDGTHASSTGYQYIQRSHIVQPSWLIH